jgi:competence protein ComEA
MKRIFIGAAIAGALVLAAIVLHPAPPPPAVSQAPETLSPARPLLHANTAAPREMVVVYVAGAVAHPGVFSLASTARVGDALDRAGGASGDADLLRVNLAAHLSDGEEIAVLRRGEGAPSARRTAAPHRAAGRKKRRALATQTVAGDATHDDAPLDLNSATAEELAALPGLGPELAERIVDYREVNGPFVSVDELADVSGMTPGRLDRLVDRLAVR